MNNLLKNPDRIFHYARLYTVSVASTMIYGQRVTSLDSFWYKEFYELMDLVRNSLAERTAYAIDNHLLITLL
jgi:hypothetical protein